MFKSFIDQTGGIFFAVAFIYAVQYINKLRLKYARDRNRALVEMAGQPGISVKDMAVLLQAGADVNCNNGQPLSVAVCAHQKKEVIELLLDHGAKLCTQPSPLLIAVTADNPKAFRLLVSRGADIRQKLDDGSDLLLCAIGLKKYSMAKMLIEEYGFDCNGSNHDGVTPLLAAAAACRFDTFFIKYLLKAGADLNCRDNNGKSFGDYIARRPYLRLLLSKYIKFCPDNSCQKRNPMV